MALYYAFFVLLFKGYKIKGMRSIDLPSNWLSLHPGVRRKVSESMHIRNKKITHRFAQKIIKGGKNFRALFDIIQDLLIMPLAIGYYFIGRFFLAKTFIANKACTNCNICINSCPVKAIKEIHNRPFWTYRCESCMRCMNMCPERAIQTCHGFAFLIFYLTYATLISFIYKILPDHIMEFIENGLLKFTLETIIVLPLYYLGYYLIHYLMKYSFMDRLISYSSLTFYKFWRRYKALRP